MIFLDLVMNFQICKSAAGISEICSTVSFFLFVSVAFLVLTLFGAPVFEK
jgi:hypothetical protein